jgi:electron transfer flavoprotein alpha subunit
MSKTGILIEIENNAVKESSLGAMTAAADSEIFALVVNADASAVKDTLANYGADTIVDIKGDLFTSADLMAEALVTIIKEYALDSLLGTASATGKDIFARVAAIMDEPLMSDVLGVNIAEKTVRKSHFSGKIIATLEIDASILLSTIRPNVIEPTPKPVAGNVVVFEAGIADPGLTKIIEVQKGDSSKLDLTEAPVIVTGGRAINGAENFAMLDACAAKLGAAVGASRAAVDAGFAPHSMQVGQTGKTVSPKLYIACGVSGAVQHFAGMKTSKVIVAINEDKHAPIFGKCDYGIIGDIFDVVPKLTEKL